MLLIQIQHPFVVSLKCAFQSETKLFLVMDYLSGGELFFHLRKCGLILEDHARFYIGEMVLALEFLHLKGIVHRDLKVRRSCGVLGGFVLCATTSHSRSVPCSRRTCSSRTTATSV